MEIPCSQHQIFTPRSTSYKCTYHDDKCMKYRTLKQLTLGWLVGWEINVPFQQKNRLYRWQGLG